MNEQQLVLMILGLSAIFATLGTVFVCCVKEVVVKEVVTDRRKPKPSPFDAVNEHNTRQVQSLIRGGYVKIS